MAFNDDDVWDAPLRKITHASPLTAKLGPAKLDSPDAILMVRTAKHTSSEGPPGFRKRIDHRIFGQNFGKPCPARVGKDSQERRKPLHGDFVVARQALIDRRGEGASLSSETAAGLATHALLAGQNLEAWNDELGRFVGKLFVARQLSKAEVRTSTRAQAATQAEWGKLLQIKRWDPDSVTEMQEIKNRATTENRAVHFCRYLTKTILQFTELLFFSFLFFVWICNQRGESIDRSSFSKEKKKAITISY